MNELPPCATSATLFSLSGHGVYAAGDAENLDKLGSFDRTGGNRGEVMMQDAKFAAFIRRKFLPHIELPPRNAPGCCR